MSLLVDVEVDFSIISYCVSLLGMANGFLMEVCVDSVESAVNAERGGNARKKKLQRETCFPPLSSMKISKIEI